MMVFILEYSTRIIYFFVNFQEKMRKKKLHSICPSWISETTIIVSGYIFIYFFQDIWYINSTNMGRYEHTLAECLKQRYTLRPSFSESSYLTYYFYFFIYEKYHFIKKDHDFKNFFILFLFKKKWFLKSIYYIINDLNF